VGGSKEAIGEYSWGGEEEVLGERVRLDEKEPVPVEGCEALICLLVL